MKCLEYLKSLIAFPTVSCDSNVEISDWVQDCLHHLGFVTERVEYRDAAGVSKVCLSGRIGPENQAAGLAYFCHTDVVPVKSWSFPDSGPWDPLVTNDRVYGRGACDMKGSLACMLSAMEGLTADDLNAAVYIVCTADEEVFLRGAQELVQKSAMYREIVKSESRAIVGEPTQLRVVHAHKGGQALRITAKGVAAHSSTGKGINANFAMFPFVTELHQIWREVESDPAWQDDRFDPSSVCMNVGLNDYTHALNITPPQSVCTVYFRTMPGQDGNALTQRIRDAAMRHSLECEVLFQGDPLYTNPDSEFIRNVLQLTGTSESYTVGYGTDGARFTDIKNIVVLGPGDIRQAHTDDEWISLDQLQRGTQLYRKLVDSWCRDS